MLVTILSGTFQAACGPVHTYYSTAGFAERFVVLHIPDSAWASVHKLQHSWLR